jgi:methyl-accepting chemotaxis protein
MDVKMDVNLRNVQEQVTDSAQQVQSMGNKTLLTYIGFWGLGYDFARDAVEIGKDLIDRAELRGEDMVRELNAQLENYTNQATDEVKKVADRVNSQVEGVSGKITDNTKSMENELEKILSRVGLSRSEVTATVIEVQEEIEGLIEPFSDYNEMTAKEIVDKLDGLDEEALKTVRAYEAGTKKRVTVLRETDLRLDAMENAEEPVSA